MSGHSKWATIKRAKAVTDAKKGKAFTKLAKNITVAVQTGGGGDPTFNFQLRQALEKAKEVGMPKDNIDRAIKRGTGEGKEAIKAVTYEGYGPAGSAFIVEAITDNSNRTLQAVRQIFERHGGKLGGEGTVAWMFESKGQILVEKQQGTEDLAKTKKFIESKGIKILSSENIMKPQQSVELSEADQTKVQTLIDALNEDDDVVAVHNNANL